MKRTLIILLAALTVQAAGAQRFYTGLKKDRAGYDKIPKKATLLTRDYAILPSSHSLRKYCPTAGDQQQYGTCTSWASTYQARTICEAIANGWEGQEKIDREAFAPLFIYAQIKNPTDVECKEGSSMPEALAVLKSKGAPKYATFPELCASRVSSALYDAARSGTIDDYNTLIEYGVAQTPAADKISRTKKALSEDRPVIIAMNLPESFFRAGEIWQGDPNDKEGSVGYHAMCVVGYDDNVNGGSFLFVNSWGTEWGKDGFTWVSYDDYARYVDQAIEMYVKPKAPAPVNVGGDGGSIGGDGIGGGVVTPQPQPRPLKKNYLAGSMTLQLSTGENVPVRLVGDTLSYYRATEEFISGTRYRIFVSNDAPAYVYVVGSDLTNSVSKVFPPADNISAHLTYRSNHIAIPDEKWFIEMDNTKGTDYLCVLYSEVELPINDIVKRIKEAPGTFVQKLRQALPTQLVPAEDVSYSADKVTFSAKTDATVVPLLVEVSHK